MSQSPAIQVQSLGKTYRDGMLFGKKFRALDNVTFDVQPGEIFGLLGPNGAGKTTFLKILLGIIRKTDGRANMLGHPAGSRPGRQLVGYLPEHLRIPAHMTGYSALECYGNLSNVPTSVVKEKRHDLLKLVGLEDRGKDRVQKYSKGMRQRLGLAQALLHEPRLLVLDEPTDGLDPRARAEIREIIRGLQSKGVTVFLNSHILQEVEMVCERVAILHRGTLRYCGSVDDLGDFVGQLVGSPIGHVVEVTVRGEQDQLTSAMADFDHELISAVDSESLLRVKSKDQSEIDRLVDRIRGAGLSLVRLTRVKVSLEDAFLRIVEKD